MYRILWIDDDVNNSELRPEKEELESRDCTIIPASTPDELLKIIKNRNVDMFDCIIVDISMPVGSLDFDRAEAGTKTGLLLIEEIEKSLFKNNKMVVYTIVKDSQVIEFCENSNPRIPYWDKNDYLPDRFADEIINVIKGTNNGTPQL